MKYLYKKMEKIFTYKNKKYRLINVNFNASLLKILDANPGEFNVLIETDQDDDGQLYYYYLEAYESDDENCDYDLREYDNTGGHLLNLYELAQDSQINYILENK
jgi:hypothetical protein